MTCWRQWWPRTRALFTTELLPVAVDTGQSAGWGATVVDTRAGLLERRGFPASPNPSGRACVSQ